MSRGSKWRVLDSGKKYLSMPVYQGNVPEEVCTARQYTTLQCIHLHIIRACLISRISGDAHVFSPSRLTGSIGYGMVFVAYPVFNARPNLLF